MNELKFLNDQQVFRVHTEGIPYLSIKMLDDLGVPNAYSTRFLSIDPASLRAKAGMRTVIMKTEDPEEAAPVVRLNRDRLARQLGSSIEREGAAFQKHSAVVRVIRDPADLGVTPKPPVDGVVTNIPGAHLTVYGADCPPVYLVDPVRRAIGLVHAGWRGTLSRIPAIAIRKMKDEFGCRPENMYAAVGPGICLDCYEMGDEVYEAFADQWGEQQAEKIFRRYPAWDGEGLSIPGGKYHLDLGRANEITLRAEGIPSGQIALSNVCTKCNADTFYSYRAHRMENEQAAMLVNRFDLGKAEGKA